VLETGNSTVTPVVSNRPAVGLGLGWVEGGQPNPGSGWVARTRFLLLNIVYYVLKIVYFSPFFPNFFFCNQFCNQFGREFDRKVGGEYGGKYGREHGREFGRKFGRE